MASTASFIPRFREFFPEISRPANRGGLELEVLALDRYSAIKAASKLLARAEIRVELSSNRCRLVHNNEAWMHPGGLKVDLTPKPPIDFRVAALDVDGGRLLFEVTSDEIEAAFDLLTGFQSGPERAACVGAWAAVES